MDPDLTKWTQILYVTSNNILHSYVKSFFTKRVKLEKRRNNLFFTMKFLSREWGEDNHLTILKTFYHKWVICRSKSYPSSAFFLIKITQNYLNSSIFIISDFNIVERQLVDFMDPKFSKTFYRF